MNGPGTTHVSTAGVSQAEHTTILALLYAVDHQLISFLEITPVAALASKVRTGVQLSHSEIQQAWRILHRYRHKLDQHGIPLPEPRATVTADQVPAGARPEIAIRDDGRIGVSNAPFAANEYLKVGLHATFEKRTRQWHLSPTPVGAAGLLTLLREADPIVSPRVRALAQEAADADEHRRVLDPDEAAPEWDLSGIVVAPLWDHQRRALVYSSAVSASMIAVPMGGGKTASTVGTVNNTPTRRLIIVCPNKVRGVWPREVAKWSAVPWHIVDGRREARRRGALPQDLTVAERLHEAEACLFDCTCDLTVHAAVFNYEMLAREPVKSWIPTHMIDMVVYDEAHRLKSPTGTVSRTAARWVDFSLRRVGLSGTPMPQFPWDIFGVYRALDPGIFGDTWTPFKKKYVETAVRQGISGRDEEFPVSIKLDTATEFAAKVHSIMYRPTIDLDLPPVTHVTRHVELEPAARRVYDSLDKAMFADLRAFARVTGAPESRAAYHRGDLEASLTPKNILSRMIRLMQLTGGTVPDDGEEVAPGRTVRQSYRVSQAKAEHLAEVLDEAGCVHDRAGGPEPVIVYGQFRSDLDAIREVAEAVGLRYAEISGRRSDGLSARSEMAEWADVVAVQIQSGGTGVDLTRARHGVWYSKGYSLGDYDQALKRQDRPGQTRPVVFTHLVCVDTIDLVVSRALEKRGNAVAAFLRSRGVDPAVLGVLDEYLTVDPVERAHRGHAPVVLPIDELKPAPWQPRTGPRPARPVVDPELLRRFDLEDL